MWSILILLLLVYLVWMRDEMRKAPLVNNASVPPPKRHDTENDVKEEYTSTHVPPSDDALSLAFDVEFNEKHPCDYQVPYILPNGIGTFICTCEEMWDRWGVKDKILANLNDGAKEQCARCVGLKCKGKRKNI